MPIADAGYSRAGEQGPILPSLWPQVMGEAGNTLVQTIAYERPPRSTHLSTEPERASIFPHDTIDRVGIHAPLLLLALAVVLERPE